MNIKYWALYPFMLPFIWLDILIFFETEKTRIWDDSIWLHRLLIWHDNLYRQSFEGEEVGILCEDHLYWGDTECPRCAEDEQGVE